MHFFHLAPYYEKRQEADKGNLFVDIRACIVICHVMRAAQLLIVDAIGVCPLCERLACLFTCQFFSYFALVLIIAFHLFISDSNAISDEGITNYLHLGYPNEFLSNISR